MVLTKLFAVISKCGADVGQKHERSYDQTDFKTNPQVSLTCVKKKNIFPHF